MKKKLKLTILSIYLINVLFAQSHPIGYFRHPLSIPMELVSNFGELRTNHWHMGLDIRTQQRENLRVYASADGYIAKVKIEPGGFGRAIYINHPNGYTTLYAHLNNFTPVLEEWVKEQQYLLESWNVELNIPAGLFKVKKGDFIAYSGNTGGSGGPHVHFEIRDTKTDKCLNPLLFGFPIADAVPPTVTRIAMYDRNKSLYHQSPQYLSIQKTGGIYKLIAASNLIKVGSNKISFAITATDRFTNFPNPNGIYSARVLVDNELISSFILDNIDYLDTRYMNAHIDYRIKESGGPWLQHFTPMIGDRSDVYKLNKDNGIITLNDQNIHRITLIIEDAKSNKSKVEFNVQYDPSVGKNYVPNATQKLIPGEVNVFESENFEVFTNDNSVYDTVNVSFSSRDNPAPGSISNLYNFVGPTIPVHDSITIRIKPSVTPNNYSDKVIIKCVSKTRNIIMKASKQGDWYSAKFRQFGTFQAFIDTEPPVINNIAFDLSKSTRISFTPTDNFNNIRYFRAELNGKWLRFSNNRGRTWVYYFDENFPKGEHELKVVVEDVAGNRTTKTWKVKR